MTVELSILVLVLLEIQFVEGPDRYPTDAAILDCEGWPDLRELADLRDKAMELYPHRDGYVIDIRVSEIEWGASAADVALVVSIARALKGLWPQVRAVFEWAARHARESDYLSEAEAEEQARLRIATKYDVQARQLRKMTVSELAEPNPGWGFEFRDARGVVFQVTVQSTKSGVPYSLISADWRALGGEPPGCSRPAFKD